jgi:hypothetical protein
MAHRPAAPEPCENFEALIELGGSRLRVTKVTECGVIRAKWIPGTETGGQSPVREMIKGDGLASQLRDVSSWNRCDHRPQADAFSSHRHRSECDPWISIGFFDMRSIPEQVVRDKESVPPRLLCLVGKFGEHSGTTKLHEVRCQVAKPHLRLLCHPRERFNGLFCGGGAT